MRFVKAEVADNLSRLRTAGGGYAMLALDQRESLREMFPPSPSGSLVGDEVLRGFKRSATRRLSPHASGVLLDYPLGIGGPHPPTGLDPRVGLLLAADDLHSERGVGVTSSTVDRAITVDLIHSTGAAGIKYLVMWRRGDRGFVREVAEFLELAAAAGVASFVEGIVRPPLGGSWRSPADRHDAIIEAAAELSRGADVYKAEVPGYSPGDLSAVREHSALLSGVVDGEWVVLSNGVVASDFPAAVEESCAGGADGFLAGRAVWADTVAEADPDAALESRAVPRLGLLASIVARSRQLAAQPESVGERGPAR